MIDERTDPPSDLGWLLQSDQPTLAEKAEALIAAHYGDVYRFALWLLRDPAVAEKAAVDTLAEAVMNAHQYREGTRLLVWLFALCVPICRRHRRRLSLRRLFAGLDTLAPAGARPPQPGGLFAVDEADARILDAVYGLVESRRLPLILRSAFGLTLPESARVLGITPERAQTRLAAAREEVEPALREGGVDVAALDDRLARLAEIGTVMGGDAEIAAAVTRGIDKGQRARRIAIPLKEIALASVIIALVALVGWIQDRQVGEAVEEDILATQRASPEAETVIRFQVDAAATLTPDQIDLATGIEAAMEVEVLAWQTGDVALFRALLDPRADLAWRLNTVNSFLFLHGAAEEGLPSVEGLLLASVPYDASLIEVEAVGDEAAAVIFLDDPDVQFYDRIMTRFYRKSGEFWLITTPYPAYWGALQEMSSPHLHVTVSTRDAETLAAVLPRAEALYQELHAALGMDLPGQPFELRIAPTGLAAGSASPAQVQEVASPGLFRPAYLSAEQALLRSMGDRLVLAVVSSIAGGSQTGAPDFPAVASVEGRELIAGISAWWVRQWVPLPEEVEVERRSILFANRSPAALSVARRLGALGLADLQPEVTQFEYLAATYGADSFGRLLRGIAQGLSWEEVLAITLGITRDELAEGLASYLEESYYSVSRPELDHRLSFAPGLSGASAEAVPDQTALPPTAEPVSPPDPLLTPTPSPPNPTATSVAPTQPSYP